MIKRKSMIALALATASAVVVALLWQWLPGRLQRLQDSFLAGLEERTGVAVSVGDLAWVRRGVDLELIASRVQVANLSIASVHADVNILRSVQMSMIVFNEVGILGSTASLARSGDAWHLIELDVPTRTETGSGQEAYAEKNLREWLALQGGVKVTDVTVRVLDGRDQSELARVVVPNLVATRRHIEGTAQVVIESETSLVRMTATPTDATLQHLGGEVTIDRLDLGTAVSHLARLFPELATEQWNHTLKPQGAISKISITLANGEPRAAFAFKGLSWQADGKIPGVQGLNGDVDVGARAGWIHLDSGPGKLDCGGLFAAPLGFRSLQGLVNYRRSDLGKWDVRWRDVDLVAHGEVKGEGHLQLEEEHPKAAKLQIKARLADANAVHVRNYLPIGIMDPGLVRWLTAAFPNGRIKDASINLNGPLATFPYARGGGEFDVNARVEGLTFKFGDDWPLIDRLDGDLAFHRDGMKVKVRSGKMQGLTLERAGAEIASFAAARPVLSVIGEVTGVLEDGVKYVAASPLKKSLSGVLSALGPSGPMTLNLDVRYPLGVDGTPTAKGKVTLRGAALANSTTGITAHDLRGTVGFADVGVDSLDIQMVMADGPAFIKGARGKAALEVDADSTLLKGHLIWPDRGSGRPLEVALDHLRLTESSKVAQSVTGSHATTLDPDPTGLPAINMSCRECLIGRTNWGTIQLRLLPIVGGVELKELAISAPSFRISASTGHWWQRDGKSETALMGEYIALDSGAAMEALGYPPKVIGAEAKGTFAIAWPGPPHSFDHPRRSGEATLTVDKGRITNPGPLLSRVLSVLNLRFLDVVGGELEFRKIDATLTIAGPIVTIVSGDANMEIAEFKTKGTVDTATGKLDQKLVVIPNFGATLPALALTFVNPLLGATLWANNKRGDAPSDSFLNRATASTYRLSGTMDEPDIKLVKLLDASALIPFK